MTKNFKFGESQKMNKAVEDLIGSIVDPEEYPYFVSDEATLLDVSTLPDQDLKNRINDEYDIQIDAQCLHLPIWRLVEKIERMRARGKSERSR